MWTEASHGRYTLDASTASQEQQEFSEVWSPSEFYKNVTLPAPLPYEGLPHTIHLDEQWHILARDLVARTNRTQWEYSTAFACIARNATIRSQPFALDLFFRDHWGNCDNPLFVTHLESGSETRAEACSIPSAIEWQGNVTAMRRVGLLHTHPDGLPFSVGDMRWLTMPHTNNSLIAAATVDGTYLLLRTKDEPADAYQFLCAQQGNYTSRERIQFQIQPRRTILTRNQTHARYCKMGLYYGKTEGPLTRIA